MPILSGFYFFFNRIKIIKMYCTKINGNIFFIFAKDPEYLVPLI